MGSPSIHISGYRPTNEKYKKMLAAYEACQAAGVPVPDDVQEFFNWETPAPQGFFVEMHAGQDGVKKFDDRKGREGYEVELAKLPKNLTHLRFYLHW